MKRSNNNNTNTTVAYNNNSSYFTFLPFITASFFVLLIHSEKENHTKVKENLLALQQNENANHHFEGCCL